MFPRIHTSASGNYNFTDKVIDSVCILLVLALKGSVFKGGFGIIICFIYTFDASIVSIIRDHVGIMFDLQSQFCLDSKSNCLLYFHLQFYFLNIMCQDKDLYC